MSMFGTCVLSVLKWVLLFHPKQYKEVKSDISRQYSLQFIVEYLLDNGYLTITNECLYVTKLGKKLINNFTDNVTNQVFHFDKWLQTGKYMSDGKVEQTSPPKEYGKQYFLEGDVVKCYKEFGTLEQREQPDFE